METTAAQKAISFALEGKWEEATKANLDTLKESPEDIDSLNRLARAYAECGKIGKAKETTQKVLKLDPVNPIAKRCHDKWQAGVIGEKHASTGANGEAFLEEPGKTKLITLLNPGDEKVLAALNSGDNVILTTHTHKVSVVTEDGKYLGRLPDDLAARLKNLIKNGNKYQILIKSIGTHDITVFARETERGKDAGGMSSFPTEKIEYVSFTPPELVHKHETTVEVTEEVPDFTES